PWSIMHHDEQTLDGVRSPPREFALGGESHTLRRMRQSFEQLFVARFKVLSHRCWQIPTRPRCGLAFAGVTKFPKPAHRHVFLGVAMVPIADVDAQTIRRQCDSDRTKIFGWIGEKILA